MRKRNWLLLVGLLIVAGCQSSAAKQHLAQSPILDEIEQPISIFATGDIMLGRFVETLMSRNGSDYPFREMMPHLSQFDIRLGNLEGPIVTNHRQTPDFSTSFSFQPGTAQLLKDQGFSMMTLANNHSLDRGNDGFAQTQNYLGAAGIDYFGHQTSTSSDYVLTKTVKGQDLVFIGLHDATIRLNQDEAVSLISRYASDPEAIVIVVIHWGTEYQLVNNQRQQLLGHAFIDAGADMIIGHHPHVVQNIEIYNERPIFYSLGNFIFDQYFSTDTQEGLTLGIQITDDGIAYQLIPVSIVKSQAQFMSDERKVEWLSRLAERSAEADSELAGQIQRGIIALPSPVAEFSF